MKSDQGYITNWAIVMHRFHGYVLIGHNGTEGHSYDHPDFKFIRTSPIVNLTQNGDGFEAETKNGIYHVRGAPNDNHGRQLYRMAHGDNS